MKMNANTFRSFLSNIDEGARLDEQERAGTDISRIMAKLNEGEDLNKFERNTLSAAVDASKNSISNLDIINELEGVVANISQGNTLDKRSARLLSATLNYGME